MTIYALFVIVVCSVLVAAMARRRGWNAPLIVLAAALAISWIPGVGHVEVEPEILLGVILPPLLYSAALGSSYQDFRAAIKPILNLGVGHVLITAFAVAAVVCVIMGNVPFAAAMVLGAVVAPPDAVAAAAVAKKLGLPRRVTNVLTGESLINDATSLTLYKVALAGVFAAGASFGSAISTFALAVVGGVGVGLALGLLVYLLRRWLNDPVVETVLGLIIPFTGYWAAEAIHGSGVLAVVAAGFLIGRVSPRESYSTRLYEEPLWAAVDLVLECFTFALIGLQLPWVWRGIVAAKDNTGTAVIVAIAVFVTVLLIRPAYVFATKFLWTVRTPGADGAERVKLSVTDLSVISWAGMRGVVTLAAAAAIPATINGQAFPHRATLQLVAYTVAIGTLLLQGLSLPFVIRRAGIDNSAEAAEDKAAEARVRRLTAEVAAETVRGAASRLTERFGDTVAQGAIDQVLTSMARRGQAAATLMASPDSHDEDEDESGDESEAAATGGDGATTLGPDPAAPAPGPGEGVGEAELEARIAREDAEAAAEPPQRLSDIGGVEDEDAQRAVRGLLDDISSRARQMGIMMSPDGEQDPGSELAARAAEREQRWRQALHQDQEVRVASAGAWRGWRRLLHTKAEGSQFAEMQKQLNVLRRQIVRAQRSVIVHERNAGRLNETVMRVMMRELDLEEEALATSWATRL